MTSELVALLDSREVGCVRNDARGRLTFVYDNDWRQSEGAYLAFRCGAGPFSLLFKQNEANSFYMSRRRQKHSIAYNVANGSIVPLARSERLTLNICRRSAPCAKEQDGCNCP